MVAYIIYRVFNFANKLIHSGMNYDEAATVAGQVPGSIVIYDEVVVPVFPCGSHN